MPFTNSHDAPWWALEGLDALPPYLEPPCACAHCVPPETGFNLHHAPDGLVAVFQAEWSAVQRHTARMWQALAAMHAAAGTAKAEFVADDIALVTNTHPRSGLHLLLTAVHAQAVPALCALVERAELSSKHAEALLEEAERWTDSDAQRDEVIVLTLERCQRNVDRGGTWPTPGELKKRLRTAALLLDLTAAEKARKRVSERRTVELMQTGIGQAQVTISGPEVAVVQMLDAIRARAEALGRLPGDARSLDERMFDAAHELLIVDGDGGQSVVPTIDDQARPVTLTVRGVELALVMPYSVGLGQDLELAEVVGLGPVLPSTARELAAQAVSVRRIAVDAATGQVLAVDDKVPGPGRISVQLQQRRDPGELVPTPMTDLLSTLAVAPVVQRDLHSSRYRVPGRLRRFVEHRDRTCTFPGCTVPGRYCDVDHREPWPRGSTDHTNCHCLCRRHHRAKQAYFTVHVDVESGDTVWTTSDGRRYLRPPPIY